MDREGEREREREQAIQSEKEEGDDLRRGAGFEDVDVRKPCMLHQHPKIKIFKLGPFSKRSCMRGIPKRLYVCELQCKDFRSNGPFLGAPCWNGRMLISQHMG